MAILITLKGPDVGKHFTLAADSTVVGRNPDCPICLGSQAVSRNHARIYRQGDRFFVEDLQSSNGTYVNGSKLTAATPLTERDTLQVGPYLFALRRAPVPTPGEDSLVIREQIATGLTSQSLPEGDAARKLRVVLEIAQGLGRTLDLEALLGKLLDQLMQLFPQADRGVVLLKQGDELVVRSQRCRDARDPTTLPYSRTIVRRALAEGVGILSEDVRQDERFQTSATISNLSMRSLLCVPLITPEGRRLGVLQLDRFRAGWAFTSEDLQLLAVIAIQVTVVLENASLHAEVLREEQLRQELALAREIQQGFLPTEFPDPAHDGFELYARLLPAREVAGDLYDFFRLGDGRLAFFVGDVSGKGMPAALFMVAVRTLGRHLASASESPAETLRRLNTALSADNPSGMFVTLAHGIYQPETGALTVASAGHPLPLLRRPDGRVETWSFTTGRLLGYAEGNLNLTDVRTALAPGETVAFYTDGFTEAEAAAGHCMFGEDRMRETLAGPRAALSLEACAEYARQAVESFTGTRELHDDLTIFLLRRAGAAPP